MIHKQNVITIDGPSGVGKSTVSRRVAAATGFTYLDTGAMYRAVGFYLLQHNVDLEDATAISKALNYIEIELTPADGQAGDVGVAVNGQDISEDIRTPEMSMVASKVSAIGAVREFLTTLQRKLGEKGNIVVEGRDTGTVVFPTAAYKFYLDAAPEIRASRRHEQLKAKGCEADFGKILELIIKRDKNDSTRAIAPLKKADDAVLVDTSTMDAEGVVKKILSAMRQVRG